MKRAFQICLGIVFILVGGILGLSVFFSEANIFKHLFRILEGRNLDFGWQQYSSHATGLILNILILVLVYFLFKKGRKMIKGLE